MLIGSMHYSFATRLSSPDDIVTAGDKPTPGRRI